MNNIATGPARFFKRFGIGLLWLLSIPYYAWAALEQGRALVRIGWAKQEPNFPFLDVLVAVGVSALEMATLFVIVRPLSFNKSWGRILVAVLVFAPWAFISLGPIEDPPGLLMAHGLWVYVLGTGLIILLPITIMSPLKWYQRIWAGLPLMLILVGGWLGVPLGGLAAALNSGIFRLRTNDWVKYIAAGVISSITIGFYIMVWFA